MVRAGEGGLLSLDQFVELCLLFGLSVESCTRFLLMPYNLKLQLHQITQFQRYNDRIVSYWTLFANIHPISCGKCRKGHIPRSKQRANTDPASNLAEPASSYFVTAKWNSKNQIARRISNEYISLG